MYLAVYPAGKKVKIFEVPENSFISEDAFNECVYLKKVYIKNMGGKWAENYDPCQTYFKNCSGIKLYLAKNYKPERVGRWYERVWIRGFDKNCKNCEIYVHKKSPLARMLDKKKIEYDVY